MTDLREIMVLPPQRHPIHARGHAALPGSGPVGETCGTCAHRRGFPARPEGRLPRAYSKCAQAQVRWTDRRDTDVKRADPACRHWEAARAPR